MIVIGSDNDKIAFFTTDFNLNLIYLIFLNLFLSINNIQMMISIRRFKMRLYFWCLAMYMFIRIRLRKIFKLLS